MAYGSGYAGGYVDVAAFVAKVFRGLTTAIRRAAGY